MAVNFDVVVDVYPYLFPFGVDVWMFWQRLQRGLVEGFEGRAARARQLLEGLLVDTIEQYADRHVEFAQGEKLAVAQGRQDPALDHLDSDFDLGLVPRFTGASGHYGDTVVLGEIAVTRVDIWLVAMCLGNAAEQIARHQDLRCAAKKSEAAGV